MDISKMLISLGAPNVPLEDIVVENLREERLLKLLMDNGIRTTGDLMHISNAELKKMPLIWLKKIQKIQEFISRWAEDGFPTRNYINIARPNTMLESLQSEVFGNYSNLELIALRAKFLTYEEIGEKYERSRQNIYDREKRVVGKFEKWLENNRIVERLGSLDEFVLYCNTNLPEDQRQMKTAVEYLVKVVKKKQSQ